MINTNYSTQGTASLTASLSSSAQTAEVSDSDEAKANLELLHLIIALRSGNLEAADLAASGSEGVAGPRRALVEQFKEAIRKIREGGDCDVAAAKNAQSGKTSTDSSLQTLLDSLPEELRNLLYSSFPNLEDMLVEEAEAQKNAAQEEGSQSSEDSLSPPLDEAALANQARVRALTPRYTEQWYDEPSLDA